MARYSLEIMWNRTQVLDATCSAVMAWENIRLMAQQFVNAEKAGYEMPTLVDLANAESGAVFTGEAKDDTGHASFVAVAL